MGPEQAPLRQAELVVVETTAPPIARLPGLQAGKDYERKDVSGQWVTLT
jgi:hypothetical protein